MDFNEALWLKIHKPVHLLKFSIRLRHFISKAAHIPTNLLLLGRWHDGMGNTFPNNINLLKFNASFKDINFGYNVLGPTSKVLRKFLCHVLGISQLKWGSNTKNFRTSSVSKSYIPRKIAALRCTPHLIDNGVSHRRLRCTKLLWANRALCICDDTSRDARPYDEV